MANYCEIIKREMTQRYILLLEKKRFIPRILRNCFRTPWNVYDGIEIYLSQLDDHLCALPSHRLWKRNWDRFQRVKQTSKKNNNKKVWNYLRMQECCSVKSIKWRQSISRYYMKRQPCYFYLTLMFPHTRRWSRLGRSSASRLHFYADHYKSKKQQSRKRISKTVYNLKTGTRLRRHLQHILVLEILIFALAACGTMCAQKIVLSQDLASNEPKKTDGRSV